MLTDTQISGLRAAFPAEALSADTSRGFELTSIKAAFIIERLNEVFGPCGCGWRYVHSPFELIEGEVVTEVALQFRVNDGGCDPVVWDAQARNWAFAPDSGAWAWPILAPGGRRPGKGNAPITDARKGAVTDGLTKAASMIGVGQEVFKGLVRTGQAPQKAPERAVSTRAAQQPGNNARAPQSGSTPSETPTKGAVPSGEHEKPAAPQRSASRAINGQKGDAGKVNGVAKSNGAAQAGTSNGAGKSNGAAQTAKTDDAGKTTGSQQQTNGAAQQGGKANGASRAAITYNATTFWSLANRYSHKLDRAVVSALAKQVVMGSMSWIEAQSQLDDLIDAASLPSFGNGSQPSVAEGRSNGAVDPLDELFE